MSLTKFNRMSSASKDRRGAKSVLTKPAKSHAATKNFPIVGIGASAGGLEAFTQLLTHLPADTGMAFVLVQHLSPDHPSQLSNLLSKATSMPVLEVKNGMPVKPNHVFVIPPNKNLDLAEGNSFSRRVAIRGWLRPWIIFSIRWPRCMSIVPSASS